MEILTWFVLGIVITNILFFVYWYTGNDIEYIDIFIYIACILSGPFSIFIPALCIIIYGIVRGNMYLENIHDKPFLSGRKRKNNKNDDGYDYE